MNSWSGFNLQKNNQKVACVINNVQQLDGLNTLIYY